MYALFIMLSGLLLFLLIYDRSREQEIFTRLRISFIQATLVSSLLIAVVTELFSAYSGIMYSSILAYWSSTFVILIVYAWYSRSRLKISLPPLFGALYDLIRRSWIIKVILLFALVSLLLAVIYPPNNYDSMTYHMARVAHWIQNRSIANYPTHIIRQLVYQPFGEWILLHLQLLAGGDRLANAVQLFFYLGCLSTISLITKELGGTRRQQLLSAFFTGLIPMVVIQSNTTQNDIVVAFYTLSFIWLTLRLVTTASLKFGLLAGVSLGLAWLTKGTAYLFTFLFILWYPVVLIRDTRRSFRTAVKKGSIFILIPVIALSLNAGYYSRNMAMTGDFFGNSSKETANKGASPKYLALGVVKNIMNHLPVTDGMVNWVVTTSARLGIDANDPRYNFGPMSWMMTRFFFHEDYVQNFPQIVLLIPLALIFLFRKRLYTTIPGKYSLVILTVFATSLLFCLLLKWQPWSNRLQTCLFMLYSILFAMELTRFGKWVVGACSLFMLAFGWKSLISSSKHPILPISASFLQQPYTSAIYSAELLQCNAYLNTKPYNTIGLVIGLDSWDYPYFKLFSKTGKHIRLLNHIMVTNESRIYEGDFTPDVILSLDLKTMEYNYHHHIYRQVKRFETFALFERSE